MVDLAAGSAGWVEFELGLRPGWMVDRAAGWLEFEFGLWPGSGLEFGLWPWLGRFVVVVVVEALVMALHRWIDV